MPVIPQKIRAGLVELRTSTGLLYANPSVWQRIYLLWTFRNFHRLPPQVLNKRQRQLIETLGRTALVSRPGPIATRPIIGSVENVEITGVEKRSLASSEKLITISPRAAVRPAVGSDSMPIGRNRSVSSNVANFPTPAATDCPRPSSATKLQSIKSKLTSFPLPGGGTYAPRYLRGVVIAIGCVAVVILAFHLREHRYVFPMNSRPALPSSDVQSRTGGVTTHPTQVVADVIPKLAEHVRPAAGVAPRTTTSGGAVETGQNQSSVDSVTPGTPPAQSPASERLRVEESPEVLTYPIAPSTSLKGRVALRAVVGTNGTVTNIAVLTGNPLLARAAQRAVRHWRYASHEANGKPVEAETDIVVNFLGDEVVSVSFVGSN